MRPLLGMMMLAVGVPLLGLGHSDVSRRRARSPAEALAQFRVDPGLRIELVAAEPDIESPVAMTFDEDGRIWVVEMRDYPNGPPPGKPPQGRIRVLEDRDGDGRFEHSRVFAEELLFANGLLPWRGGVIVTAAPHILHLRDTNGDGKADQREVLFEGFAAKNPQLRVSHPVLGIDNWVYVANGIMGGDVKRHGKTGASAVSINGMDFRFDPLNPDRYEAIAGMGQFGNTFDDWGERFVCTNRNHIIHMVLPNRYVKRNPFLAVPGPVMPDQNPGGAAKIYPLSKHFTTALEHHGSFTSACGVFIYRGTLLPARYRGTAFTCEPAGNLIHQSILKPSGATFEFRRAREGVEFLATPDDWCRPVSLASGPDGAIYVVDMYRAVVEHPEYMPAELKNRPDLHDGKECGRIWRIIPEKSGVAGAESSKPRHVATAGASKTQLRPPSRATAQELVALLAHPDAGWRNTAQRLLLERQDRSAIPLLYELCRSSGQPLARVHAASLLDSFGALDEKLVHALLQRNEPRLREHGVRFAERWLAQSDLLQRRLIELARDPDARVRFQVALSLGEWDDDRILPPLMQIASAGADDRWTRLAVASSVPHRAGALITLLVKDKAEIAARSNSEYLQLLQELATVVGARRDEGEIVQVLTTLGSLPNGRAAPLRLSILIGLAEGMGRRGTQLAAFLQSLSSSKRHQAEMIESLLDQAAGIATDADRGVSERKQAIRLLAHASWPKAEVALTRLITDEQPPEIRLETVRALAAHVRPESARILLESWARNTPPIRREVIEAMLQRTDRITLLLDEVEAGRVKPADLDALRVRQLTSSGDPTIRTRALKLFKDNLPEERKQVLERYKTALSVKGNLERGREIFRAHCSTCHQIAGIGVNVGPDISDLRLKTPEQVLTDVLNPNQAIDNNYVNYVLRTKDGKMLTGLIAAETSTSLTLRRAENQTDVVLRQDVDELQSTGVSLMPEGLEKNVSGEDMAHLIMFLKNWRYVKEDVPVRVPNR